jgi:hypothetical protein
VNFSEWGRGETDLLPGIVTVKPSGKTCQWTSFGGSCEATAYFPAKDRYTWYVGTACHVVDVEIHTIGPFHATAHDTWCPW